MDYKIENSISGPIIIFDDGLKQETYFDIPTNILNIIKELQLDNQQLELKLQQKEDIIYKIKKCIEEKEEYYGDYMGDGNYTMYSMMGANNNRISYIKSNLIKQILDNKGDENDG